MQHVRWSDNDRHLGPITISTGQFAAIGIMLSSTDDEDRPANIRVHILNLTMLAPLPGWLIRPKRTRVKATYWSEAEIARIGRDWYWNIDEREFGFYFADVALHVHFGAQTGDSTTDRNKCYFYPWRDWRVVRTTLYDADGQKFADLPDWEGRPAIGDTPDSASIWEQRQAVTDACPTVRFIFLDFDGEEITATTRVEETERKWGLGRWKWLSLFRRPRVARSLDIRFSSEVGRRKGSWKGGTVGHGITMKPDEDHEGAFRRYCSRHDLAFRGESGCR